MSCPDPRIVRDTRVFEARSVSADYGRKLMLELEARGEISPYRTPEGQYLLSLEDAETLARSL